MKPLRERLLEYVSEVRWDYDSEEIVNFEEILADYEDDCGDLSNIDITILQRIIDDNELYDELNDLRSYEDEDPFTSLYKRDL